MRLGKILIPSLILGVLAGTSVAGWSIFQGIKDGVKTFESLNEYNPPIVTSILAVGEKGNPELIAEFFHERRIITPLAEIPKKLIQCFLVAEDENFFHHEGVSWFSIGRAAVKNFIEGHVVQGGSTITQQVAKSLFLKPERSYARKIRELFIAKELEEKFTKEEILFLYLNQIYLGHGAYGVSSAAKAYFNKDLNKLEIHEMALMAALTRAPSAYSPFNNPKKAKELQLYVLKRLEETGSLQRGERELLAAKPIVLTPKQPPYDRRLGYAVEQIRKSLIASYGENDVYEAGLHVVSTINIQAQIAAQESVQQGLRELEARLGYRGPIGKFSTSEIPAALDEIRERNVDGHYKAILRPDGTLQSQYSESELLSQSPSSTYEAIVVSVSDFALTVDLGFTTGFIDLKSQEWLKTWLNKNHFEVGHHVLVLPKGHSNAKMQFSLDSVPRNQAALASVDHRTGEILALVGGFDAKRSEFNRAVQSRRQPGSAMKPLIFAAAMEKGMNPATTIVDAPIVFDNAEQGRWKPKNYEEKFYGDTLLRQALIDSRNIPTVKLVQYLGVRPLIEFLKRLGWRDELPPDYSIALGSSTVSPLELAEVYAIFPRLGAGLDSHLIKKVLDRSGKMIFESMPSIVPDSFQDLGAAVPVLSSEELMSRKLLLDPRVAAVTRHLMEEVVQFGTGKNARSSSFPVAGKTGTTSENRDAWFVGFSPNIVTATWVGNDELESLGSSETGGGTVAPIWNRYMSVFPSERHGLSFRNPPGLVELRIHAKTGVVVNGNPPGSLLELFVDLPTHRPAKYEGQDLDYRQLRDTQNEALKEDF